MCSAQSKEYSLDRAGLDYVIMGNEILLLCSAGIMQLIKRIPDSEKFSLMDRMKRGMMRMLQFQFNSIRGCEVPCMQNVICKLVSVSCV